MDSKDTVKGRACLPLNLYQEWDDEEDLAYKNILVSLVEGNLDPSEAARQIDAVLLQRYAARYDLLRSRPNPLPAHPGGSYQRFDKYPPGRLLSLVPSQDDLSVDCGAV